MGEAIGRTLEQRAPRYTSYPTALSFSHEVDGGRYASWLGALARGTSLSLYLHIPFCRSMCWFCARNSMRSKAPVTASKPVANRR